MKLLTFSLSFLFLLSACSSPPAPPPHQDSAATLLAKYGVSVTDLPSNEAATNLLTLFSVVADWCEPGEEEFWSDPDKPDWTGECIGACGTQAIYLSAFVQGFGYESRLVNFYNVPFQGNHTVVEVMLDGKWVMLDPTFGIFFLDSESDLASADEIWKRPGIFEARQVSSTSTREFLHTKNYFGFEPSNSDLEKVFWTTEGYSMAEFVAPAGLDPLPPVSFKIPLIVGEKFPTEECVSTNCSEEWLEETNARLVHGKQEDWVSFLARKVGDYGEYFQNSPVITLLADRTNLDPGAKIQLNIEIDAPIEVELCTSSGCDFHASSTDVFAEFSHEELTEGVTFSVPAGKSATIISIALTEVSGSFGL